MNRKPYQESRFHRVRGCDDNCIDGVFVFGVWVLCGEEERLLGGVCHIVLDSFKYGHECEE